MLERVLRENADAQANRLAFFVRLLDRLFETIPAQEEDAVAYTLMLASILRIRQSARAAQLLAAEGCAEEILVIGRALIETTINAVYLQYAADPEVSRFLRFHPEYLRSSGALMQQQRRSGLGSVLARIEHLVLGTREERLDGRSDPSWTQRSLLDRAQFCDERSEAPILRSMVERCYARSHAALHGTAGALDSFMTALELGRPLEREDRLSDLGDALFTVNLCLLSLTAYLNHTFRLGMEESISEAANAGSDSSPSLEGGWQIA